MQKQTDWWLASLVILMFGAGLTVLYSAGGEVFFWRQFWRGAAGVLLMAGLSRLSARWLQFFSPLIFFGVLAALIAVPLFGVKINNARRWLNLGIYIQPSEFMKIALPLGMAFCYGKLRAPRWFHHLGFLALIGAPFLLVARQPDLGTATMIAAAGVATVFFAGIGLRWVAGFAVAGVAMLPVLWNFVLKPYQQNRILTLFDPYQDPLGGGYHTIQSQIAVGSGGVWGKGFQSGTQAQLGFLPERHTDFIFAVYAEEFGLAGSVCLLALVLLITWRGLVIAATAADRFGALAAGGITATFFLTVMVNLSMVSGLLPVVGMPLPLVSYGGTALLATFAGFGIVLAIARQRTMLRGGR